MRVLHLPHNIASLPSHTVRGLRGMGVEADGLTLGGGAVQSTQGLRVVRAPRSGRVVRTIDLLAWFAQMRRLAARADVLHWYYGRPVLPYALDVRWLRGLGKPALVEWMGSDIRRPELEVIENRYYAQALQNGYEYARTEAQGNSQRFQRLFAEAGFACAADRGLEQYIDRDVFPSPFFMPRRLVLEDYPEAYPDPQAAMPLVVHSPTAPVAKGTAAVLKAVEQVKAEFPFEFKLVEGLPHDQAIQWMGRADIVLDQFVLGDYGMATLEAMACGKPVICYIKESLERMYSSELPVVNADQEGLAAALEELLQDGKRRKEIGQAGRAYTQKYADMKVVGPRLVEVYRQVIHAKGTGC